MQVGFLRRLRQVNFSTDLASPYWLPISILTYLAIIKQNIVNSEKYEHQSFRYRSNRNVAASSAISQAGLSLTRTRLGYHHGRLQARMENDHRLVLIGRILPQLGPQLGPGFTRSPRRKAKNAPGFMGLFYVPAFSTNSSTLS